MNKEELVLIRTFMRTLTYSFDSRVVMEKYFKELLEKHETKTDTISHL